MQPQKLKLNRSIPMNFTHSGAVGGEEKKTVFQEYLIFWKELLKNKSSVKTCCERCTGIDFIEDEIYQLQNILGKAYIVHSDSEYIENGKYFETFTLFFPKNKDHCFHKYKKVFSHRYLLGATGNGAYYVSCGLLNDQARSEFKRYRVSKFYMEKDTLRSSLESFYNGGFWFDTFCDSAAAVFKSVLNAFDHEAKRTAIVRKAKFLGSIANVLLQESFSKLSFERIREDFKECFRVIHGDHLEAYDPNLLEIVIKQRYERFIENSRLTIEDGYLNPDLNKYKCSAVFAPSRKDTQTHFWEIIANQKTANPYAIDYILNDEHKESLMLDIIRSQFALNYMGKVHFSASYLIENRDKPDKKTLYLLRYEDKPLPAVKLRTAFSKLYPALTNFLNKQFG